MAQTLLDVPKVRLYQDSLFHKRAGDGSTPWHSDARMAPFDTSHMITFWIPLQSIARPEDGGTGLYFVDKSHLDFALPFWNRVPVGNIGDEEYHLECGGEYDRLDERYGGGEGIKNYMPLAVGDCTIHAGWTLHSANEGMGSEDLNGSSAKGGQQTQDRYALAVTFVDAMAEVREDVVASSSTQGLGHN